MSLFANLMRRSYGWTHNDCVLQRVMIATITQNRYFESKIGYLYPLNTSYKRRKTWPFHWWPRKIKRQVPFKDNITYDNKKFLDEYIKDKYELKDTESPIKGVELAREPYVPGSQRCGLICKIIGHFPMWFKNGKRTLCVAVQVVDNHVIKYHTPEEFEAIRRPHYVNAFHAKDKAVVVVGAQSADPRKFPAEYRGLFEEAGVMPKMKLTRFFVTENAKLTPGTPLYATHFRPGDWVDIWGTTKDWKFQGVVKRWKFRGLPKEHGVTKAHNRGGTIGHGRKLQPLKGTKMPGHMGSERRVHKGFKILRINTEHNVIWIRGVCVPGTNGHWVYLYDSNIEGKRYSDENPPPFPTYFPDESKEVLPVDLYDNEVQRFEEPTIIFEETEAERKATQMALRAKKAKVAKIR